MVNVFEVLDANIYNIKYMCMYIWHIHGTYTLYMYMYMTVQVHVHVHVHVYEELHNHMTNLRHK